MKNYKLIFIAITICHIFSGGAGRPVSSISAVPASAPDASSESDTFTDYSFTGSSSFSTSSSTSFPPESQIPAVPAPSPAVSQTFSVVSSPGPAPAPEEIDIDFDEVINVEDLVPKFENIHNFDFSAMKIDTTAKDLCTSTDYTNECIAAILPDLRKRAEEGKSSVDPEEVIRMEAQSLFKKANATLQYAKRVTNDGSTEEPVKEAMSVCLENYDSLITDLDEAKKAMDSGDYGRLESVLSAAISDVSTCSDNFVGVPGVDSPTASLDDFMRKLCSNILAMSQKIQNRR
ncbi:PREDICTED: uncharacterized protein LOC104817455 [Tarenaya hassleriana]|uniref:uncharacterized protein LOC104817455 n=1 Tax=Tarenaya hassleriana TaxID=28532 RepID=UPI00053C1A1A|nr:PREDICTED: uncharacterized protein LOC104817455 [Tarenaya hassleriana]